MQGCNDLEARIDAKPLIGCADGIGDCRWNGRLIIIGLDRGRPFLVDRVLRPDAGERLNPNAGCPRRALMRLDQHAVRR